MQKNIIPIQHLPLLHFEPSADICWVLLSPSLPSLISKRELDKNNFGEIVYFIPPLDIPRRVIPHVPFVAEILRVWSQEVLRSQSTVKIESKALTRITSHCPPTVTSQQGTNAQHFRNTCGILPWSNIVASTRRTGS